MNNNILKYKQLGSEPIFIIGYMGCGKSTVGKKLALELGFDFVDTDDLIVAEAGQTIKDIFSKEGEKAFRTMEKKLLKQLVKKQNTIISTGGGMPCFNDNMAFMNEHGITIYLKASAQVLASRLLFDTNRPLIANKSEAELQGHIEKMLKSRRRHYQSAKIRVLAKRKVAGIVKTLTKQLI